MTTDTPESAAKLASAMFGVTLVAATPPETRPDAGGDVVERVTADMVREAQDAFFKSDVATKPAAFIADHLNAALSALPVPEDAVEAMRAALEPLARHDGDPLDVSHITRAHVKAARAALAAPTVGDRGQG